MNPLPTTPPPNLSPTLFWDSDFAKIDWVQHAPSVIERVLARGTVAEWREVLRYYGIPFVRDAVMGLRTMSRPSLYFCSAIFDIPKEQFRCYTATPSSLEPWNC